MTDRTKSRHFTTELLLARSVRIYVLIYICVFQYVHMVERVSCLPGHCMRIGIIGSSPCNDLSEIIVARKNVIPCTHAICIYLYVCMSVSM